MEQFTTNTTPATDAGTPEPTTNGDATTDATISFGDLAAALRCAAKFADDVDGRGVFMTDLTMGPLPAKVKDERGSAGDETRVFRCGVRDCPERLATAFFTRDEWSLYTSEGYAENSQGVFIKTRRAVIRDCNILSTRESRKDRLQQREGAYLTSEGCPLVFKCARCGRLSKISRNRE